MSITTLNDFLIWAEQMFNESELYFGHGTDNAWDEAVAIAAHVLELPPNVKQEVGSTQLSSQEIQTLKQIALKRMIERIPVPYLTREAWFAGLKFYVDERVIIPRSPLAELIQQQFQPWIKTGRPIRRILDLCTGCGCIAIACAYAFPEAQVDAVEISDPALEVASKNIQAYGLEDRIQLLKSDLFEACIGRQYDIIISNPPYVDLQDMAHLPKEFQWEPKLALSAGEDGLAIVNRILKQAPLFLEEEGILIVEVGNSEEALANHYPQIPFTWIEFERGGHGVFILNAEDKACWQIS